MNIIKPYFEFEDKIDGQELLSKVERAGRTCYKSEDKISADSAEKFVKALLKRGHESVIEHASLSARIICDRGVTHEIVRHRIASYSQESTRYCNYANDKFGNELTFIMPCFLTEGTIGFEVWKDTMQVIETNYIKMLENGSTPEEARSILPNSLKTEIFVTMNLREWRHFFRLRAAKEAHPQMREIALIMLEGFKKEIPVFFDDL